jgi:DNA polymerase-3 subunit alpha
VQPIVGTLLPVVVEDTGAGRPGSVRREPEEIALLVQDETGYRNLCRLLSLAYLHGGEEVEVSLAQLAAHADGLIALCGGANGPCVRALQRGDRRGALSAAEGLARAFPGRLYIEIQRHGDDAELETEADVLDLAYRLGLPLVATADARFLDAADHEAHDALTCIAEGAYVADQDRRRLSSDHRLLSPDEMIERFVDLPEAIANTLVVARRCAFAAPSREPILPSFTAVRGAAAADAVAVDEPGELRRQAREGLEARLMASVWTAAMDEAERERRAAPYRERLEFELDVIIQMRFAGYFLIVSDFIKWAKAQGIPVGPGRGSGAGSVAAWALSITDLDPLRFGLLFERFLNPERVSMPDFDVDFCQDRRDEVIGYVRERYGHDRVAAIITFGKLQARAVLRDVGRVLGLPYGLVDRISKLVPHNPANPPTLAQALEMEPRLREARDQDPNVARMINIAMQLEGLPRHASTHAAGVVIGDRPLDELVPLYRDPRSPMPVTQFNMKDVEKAGLVKFDFLGLTTLTMLRLAESMVRERGTELVLDRVPLDDRETYALLSRAETAGVFQLESSGMRDALRKLKPDCFEDIIAMVSLYRPGPMDNIPRYINVKHGAERAEYLHPLLEPILAETNGVIIYQEQVMQIARELAGYTLGGADLLRRAMGKKIKAEMDAQREVFVRGAVARGIEPGLASTIFEQVAKFASYGFNKSHAAAYALLAYQTAYLKANHPVEFFAASMTLDMANQDKLANFQQELRQRGIPLYPPDVNRSAVRFAVEDGPAGTGVRYALAAIRGVGAQAMEALVAERRANGPFTDLFDLTLRVGSRALNKRLLEALARAGALDGLAPSRAAAVAAIDTLLRHAAVVEDERASHQASLFGGPDSGTPGIALPPLPDPPEWPTLERLQYELDAIGFYLSAHPLDGYQSALERLGVTRSDRVRERLQQGDGRLTLAGVALGKQERVTERTRLAYVQLSDPGGSFEVTVFAELLGHRRDLLEGDRPLLIDVDARLDGDIARLTAIRIEPLDAKIGQVAGAVEIQLTELDAASKIRSILEAGEPGARVRLRVPLETGEEVVIALEPRHSLPPARRLDVERTPGIAAVRELSLH